MFALASPATTEAAAICERLLQVGVIVQPTGEYQNVLKIKPPLRITRDGAIERIGMGTFNKVFLQFPQRFWEEDIYAIRQWGAPSFPWHSWYDVSAVSKTPVLLTFAGGD